MAYASRGSTGNRAATAVGVALLQGVVIYAVATGLAVHFIPAEEKPNPIADQMPITPTPVPPPPPGQKKPVETDPIADQTHRPVINDRSEPPVVPPNDFATESASSGSGAAEGTGTNVIPDPPKPQPSFTPQTPRPTSSPGTWATSADYPAADLRRESQGVTRFAVSVGADGKVQSCRIVVSSGSPSLDETTCKLVTRRARFKPATDETGAQVAGTYSNAIRWEIPRD